MGVGSFFRDLDTELVLGKKARHNEKRKAGGIEEETQERRQKRREAVWKPPQSIKDSDSKEREGRRARLDSPQGEAPSLRIEN
jgi:hypothetical protein